MPIRLLAVYSFFVFASLPTLLRASVSVIFIHPDGAGLAQWQAARFVIAGPDGEINWDRLSHIAVYRGHMSDCLTATSNAGAVAHAYGVRLHARSFGLEKDSGLPPVSASNRRETLMQEAIRKGLRTGLINSGSIIEPGTAVFVSAVAERKMFEDIALQVVESGVDIILSGGERWMIPENQQGRHGTGGRQDGRNLIKEAEARGYVVVYNARELSEVPPNTRKLLGVFASEHTFHDAAMESLRAHDLPLYMPEAPTLAQMTAKALELLKGTHFFLVVEEEGTDNFGNANNAPGVLESLRRADETIGVALDFVRQHPNTLVITTSDSVAAGWDVIGLVDGQSEHELLAQNGRDPNGAPYGLSAEGTPFFSAPDATGKTHSFVISWGTKFDTSGGVLVRAAGHGAEKVKGSVENTQVYAIMREVLFSGEACGVEQ